MLENAKLRGQLEVAEESLKDSQSKLKKLYQDLSAKQDLIYENIAKSRESDMRYAKMLLKLQSFDSCIDAEEFELTDREIEKARKLSDMERENMEGGLKKAETNAHEAKLFKISGGMRPVMQEVDMAWSSMNHGDVFVLDSGKKIF